MTQVFHVRSWRKKMKWSRKEAAERLGLSVHTIKSYELHRRDLSKPIQQLMERLEEEQNALMSEECLNQSDKPVQALIVGGAFGQSMDTFLQNCTTLNTQATDQQRTTQQKTEHYEIKKSLMAFRPCVFDVSLELLELCQARGTEAGALTSAINPTRSFQTVDQLKHDLIEARQKNPSVVFLSCTVPQTKFAFESVRNCFEHYATEPVVVSFYSYFDTEHTQLEEEMKKDLIRFGDYLFVEKYTTPMSGHKSTTKPVYAVLDTQGNYTFSWNKDRELVLAQLLALLYPEVNSQGIHICNESMDSDEKDNRFLNDTKSKTTNETIDGCAGSFTEKNIYKAKKPLKKEKNLKEEEETNILSSKK